MVTFYHVVSMTCRVNTADSTRVEGVRILDSSFTCILVLEGFMRFDFSFVAVVTRLILLTRARKLLSAELVTGSSWLR